LGKIFVFSSYFKQVVIIDEEIAIHRQWSAILFYFQNIWIAFHLLFNMQKFNELEQKVLFFFSKKNGRREPPIWYIFRELSLEEEAMVSREDCFHVGAKALLRNTEGKLLILQKSPKKPHHSSKDCFWDLPGGRLQKNESMERALKREIHEETGLNNIIEISPFTMVMSNIRIPFQEGDVGLIFAVYLCHIPDNDPLVQLSNEHLNYRWVLPQEAAELLAANHPLELTEKIGQL
jgi:8-oxo-dGTP diphosphatase